jgi:hypothetical protein
MIKAMFALKRLCRNRHAVDRGLKKKTCPYQVWVLE